MRDRETGVFFSGVLGDRSETAVRRGRYRRLSGFFSIVRAGCCILLALCILPGISSAAIHTTLGSDVHLSGISYGSSNVYLFVTGPNLPMEGAAPNNIAAGGGMTRVGVDVDGSWSYDWDTHAIPLDAGSYTVWVVDAPVGRAELAGHDYATITVTFSRPYVSVPAAVVPGSLEIHAIPENSSVVVGGQYRGMTPLTLRDLSPGPYIVTISHFSYKPSTRSVTVEAGSTTVMNVTLAPQTGGLRIVTSPNAARIQIDGRDAGISPLTLQDIAVGNHTVVAHQEGYRTTEQEVSVPAGQTVNISLTLLPSTPAPSATQAGNAGITVLLAIMAGIAGCAILRRK
ncbi:MAG TPA: PEGA domain-containing protein [Methanoregulaceae archaeon]|nr:PEGA domain-containing protein [Methanoregulaceae archaeon]